MDKLLKIVKITFYVLLFALAITFVVCLFAIPQETKDFVALVIEKLSTPIGITGISVVGFCIIAYKFFAVIPFGKSAKERLLKELEHEKNMNKAYREEIAKKVNELNNTKNECVATIGAYQDKLDILEEELLKVCETSPNARIKALGEEYKSNKFKVEREIANKYDLVKNSVVSKVDETNANYNSILEEIKKLKESVYGKETTND